MPGQHNHVAAAALLLVALVWGLSSVPIQDGGEEMALFDFLASCFVRLPSSRACRSRASSCAAVVAPAAASAAPARYRRRVVQLTA